LNTQKEEVQKSLKPFLRDALLLGNQTIRQTMAIDQQLQLDSSLTSSPAESHFTPESSSDVEDALDHQDGPQAIRMKTLDRRETERVGRQSDEAASFLPHHSLAAAGGIDDTADETFELYSPTEDAAVLRKLDRRLVLFMALLYMLSFLDRSSMCFVPCYIFPVTLGLTSACSTRQQISVMPELRV